MDYKKPPILTILVLGINKSHNLDEMLNGLLADINKYNIDKNNLEIIISKNNLTYRAKKIARKYSNEYDFIKLYQDKDRNTFVIQDLISTLKIASGNYIWPILDDLNVYSNSLNNILKTLKYTDSEFVLMNCDIVDMKQHKYPCIQANIDLVEYTAGKELFTDFGLFYSATRLSCMLFKKAHLQVDLFKEIFSISPIYSQIFLFFISFYDKKASFLSQIIGKYKIYLPKRGFDFFQSTFIGKHKIGKKDIFLNLDKIIKYSLTKTNISFLDMFKFHETFFSKDTGQIQYSTTGGMIVSLYFEYILHISSNRIITKSVLLKNIDSIVNILSILRGQKGHDISSLYIDLILLRANLLKISSRFVYSSNMYSIYLEKCFEKTHRLNNKPSNTINNNELYNLQKAYIYYEDPIFCRQLNNSSSKSINFPRKQEEELLLTILIPTYNRVFNVEKLLKSLYTKNNLGDVKNIEILIAINNSNDGTIKICKKFERIYRNLNYIYFEEFVYSAEENISRAIPYCNGEYVHILGDDDLIIKTVYFSMLSTLYNSNVPVLIYNNTEHDDPDISKYYDDLEIGKHKMEGLYVYDDYTDIVKKYGITTTMAFISRYVIRRDLLKPMDEFISISRIYSHVFAFLSYFKDQKVVLLDMPLIARYDSQVVNRFKGLANDTGENFYYPWTTGILKHIKHSISLGVLSNDYLFNVVETISKERMFYLWKEIMIQLAKQNILYLKNFDEIEKPSPETVKLIANLLSNFKSSNTNTAYYHACLFIYIITSHSCFYKVKIYDKSSIIEKLEIIISILAGNLHDYPRLYEVEKTTSSRILSFIKQIIKKYRNRYYIPKILINLFRIIIKALLIVYTVIEKQKKKFVIM